MNYTWGVRNLVGRRRRMVDGGPLEGRQVADRPGAVNGQLISQPTSRRPDWMPEQLWRPDETAIRYGGDQTPEAVLVVRRVDPQTARITDLDGGPYSPLMRIKDAIDLLNQTKGTQ